VGARLLPQLPEPAPGLPRRLVERRQLGRGRTAGGTPAGGGGPPPPPLRRCAKVLRRFGAAQTYCAASALRSTDCRSRSGRSRRGNRRRPG
jgi:hypothetical protein